MMRARAHAVFGAATAQGFALMLGLPHPVVFMISAAAGSLYPDLDHPKAPIARLHVVSSHFLRKHYPHRGEMHSLHFAVFRFGFVLVLLSAATTILGSWLAPELFTVGFDGDELTMLITAGLTLGYISHLFADMLNVTGVPMLYPSYPQKMSIAGLKVGGLSEKVIELVLSVWIIIRWANSL